MAEGKSKEKDVWKPRAVWKEGLSHTRAGQPPASCVPLIKGEPIEKSKNLKKQIGLWFSVYHK